MHTCIRKLTTWLCVTLPFVNDAIAYEDRYGVEYEDFGGTTSFLGYIVMIIFCLGCAYAYKNMIKDNTETSNFIFDAVVCIFAAAPILFILGFLDMLNTKKLLSEWFTVAAIMYGILFFMRWQNN